MARHVLGNTVLWAMALTLHHELHFSEYWTERVGEFDVLPGRTLVDAYAAMGREEEHARAYVKLQEVARILKVTISPSSTEELPWARSGNWSVPSSKLGTFRLNTLAPSTPLPENTKEQEQ